jgi:hypothetical protein
MREDGPSRDRPRQCDLVNDLMDLHARLIREQHNVKRMTERALWMEQSLRKNGRHADSR